MPRDTEDPAVAGRTQPISDAGACLRPLAALLLSLARQPHTHEPAVFATDSSPQPRRRAKKGRAKSAQ
jgi:hypothetical protein